MLLTVFSSQCVEKYVLAIGQEYTNALRKVISLKKSNMECV